MFLEVIVNNFYRHLQIHLELSLNTMKNSIYRIIVIIFEEKYIFQWKIRQKIQGYKNSSFNWMDRIPVWSKLKMHFTNSQFHFIKHFTVYSNRSMAPTAMSIKFFNNPHEPCTYEVRRFTYVFSEFKANRSGFPPTYPLYIHSSTNPLPVLRSCRLSILSLLRN